MKSTLQIFQRSSFFLHALNACLSSKMPRPMTSTLCALLILFTISNVPAKASEFEIADSDKPQGQSNINIIRHAASISATPFTFARTHHMLLSRRTVPFDQIWDVDRFTMAIHSRPNALDWVVADINTTDNDVVTLSAAFSCMDLGDRTSAPIQFFAAHKLLPELNASNDTGFVRITNGPQSLPDTVFSCLESQSPRNGSQTFPNFKLYQLEQRNPHKGEPVVFVPFKPIPKLYCGDNSVFDNFLKARGIRTGALTVAYDKTYNIPLTHGLPFETGFRLWAADAKGFRLPLLPLVAVNKNMASRLEHENIEKGKTRTSSAEVWLNVLSNGLTLILAVFFLTRFFVDSFLRRSARLALMPVKTAVYGNHDRWDVSDSPLFIFSMLSAVIIVAPITLAAVEGKLDPNKLYQVTTGASVVYGIVQQGPTPATNFTIDGNNPFAGAPFIVTSWMSVRPVNEGHFIDLILSCVFVGMVIFLLIVIQTREMNEVMPSNSGFEGRWSLNWSFWRWLGDSSLGKWKSKNDPAETKHYRVFVRLVGDIFNTSSNRSYEVLPVALGQSFLENNRDELDSTARRMGAQLNEVYNNRRSAIQPPPSSSLPPTPRTPSTAHWSTPSLPTPSNMTQGFLIADVELTNNRRYNAMMTMSKKGEWHIPRQWEFISRGLQRSRFLCKNMNYYRTRGQTAPDAMLLLAVMGMLPYMEHVEEVDIYNLDEQCIDRIDIGLKDTMSSTVVTNGPRFREWPSSVDTPTLGGVDVISVESADRTFDKRVFHLSPERRPVTTYSYAQGPGTPASPNIQRHLASLPLDTHL